MGMRFLLVVAAVALVAAGCDIQVGEKGFSLDIAHGKAVDEWVRTYSLPANGRVEIDNVNGTIEILPAQGRDVEVRADREARFHSEEAAREALQKIQMREEVTRDRVTIGVDGSPERSFADFAQHGRVSIRYKVRLPAGLTVSMKTRNGGIRVHDVSGRVEASTTNGAITVQGLSGSLDATVVNGAVRADLAEVKDDVKISSTNGRIRLALPADVKAVLEAEWVNGGIDIDSAFGVAPPDSSARQLTAKLNGGGPRISISSVNGGVRIRPRGGRETD